MAINQTGLGPISWETKSARVVSGRDIGKTECRLATEEERWRYGVERRRIGSKWAPQQRTPHYPTPEPYVYRRQPQSLAWRNSDSDIERITKAYHTWLDSRQSEAFKRPAVVEGRKTRLIKCACQACGYIVRTARVWIDDKGAPHCPDHGQMTVSA